MIEVFNKSITKNTLIHFVELAMIMNFMRYYKIQKFRKT